MSDLCAETMPNQGISGKFTIPMGSASTTEITADEYRHRNAIARRAPRRRLAPYFLLVAVLAVSLPRDSLGEESGAAKSLGPLAAAGHSTLDSTLDSTSDPISASNPSSMRLADLDGRWRQLESGPDESDRLKAIDTAVESLTWVVRKMAGGVLRSTTAPQPMLHFVWDGARLHERVRGKRGAEARPIVPGAGPVSAIDSRGEAFEGAWLWTPEGLRFSWRQHQAYGANLYRLDEAKRELTVDHAIHVTAIDGVRPILYRSRFAKDGLPAVSAAGDDRER